MNQETWQHNIDRALMGHELAWKSIYSQLSPIILKTIRKKIYGIPGHAAKDILQDVMIKVFLNLNSYKPDKNFVCWIMSITANHCIDLSRKRKPDIEFCDQLDIYECKNKENCLEDLNEKEIPSVDLYNFSTGHLDELHNRIVLDKYNHGLKQREIAQQYNLPLGSISGKQANAIQSLRKKAKELDLDRGDFY